MQHAHLRIRGAGGVGPQADRIVLDDLVDIAAVVSIAATSVCPHLIGARRDRIDGGADGAVESGDDHRLGRGEGGFLDDLPVLLRNTGRRPIEQLDTDTDRAVGDAGVERDSTVTGFDQGALRERMECIDRGSPKLNW